MLFDFTGPDRWTRAAEEATGIGKTPSVWHGLDIQREADRIVLAKYAPAGVIVDENLDILQFRGQTGPFLAPAPGLPSLNLLKMAREGLQLDLRTAIDDAKKADGMVRREGLRVRADGHYLDVNLVVIPISIPTARHRCFTVLFEEADPTGRTRAPKANAEPGQTGEGIVSQEDATISRLRHELAGTKEYLEVDHRGAGSQQRGAEGRQRRDHVE